MSCCHLLISIIGLYIFFSTIAYIIFVIPDYCIYNRIEIYIEEIEKTWNNYPILDISLTRKYGYKEIILMDMKDINIICDSSHIEEFKLQYKGYCSDYKLEVGCNEYNPKNKASKIYGTKYMFLYMKQII